MQLHSTQPARTGSGSKVAPPGVRVEHLTLRYGENTIFDNLNLRTSGGRLTALLGVSGVGKTSLLKIIAGLIEPTAGRVIGTDDRPVFDRIAYMGQQDLLLPWLSVFKNVTLGARLRRETVDQARAWRLLEQVGLAAHHKSLPAALSGGMRQRAAIARTLYERRPIVLMDEPFCALDAITRANIHELAAEMLGGRTVLLITHDPLEAARLGHHLVVLQGRPATARSPIAVAGEPPRSPDDPNLQNSQAQLLRLLMERQR